MTSIPLSDNHYTESKEDQENRIFRSSNKHQYKEEHADDDRDADFEKEANR